MNSHKDLLPCCCRAESDLIICTCTGEGAGGVVVGVAIRPRAHRLEHFRVHRRPASIRRAIRPTAAVLRPAERLARAPARLAVGAGPELCRATAAEVSGAACGAALASAAGGRHRHRQVVAVDQADVVEVHPAAAAEGELGEGGRRGGTGTAALRPAGAAVAGGAGALPFAIEGASGAAPEAAGPAGGGLEGAGGALPELEPSRLQRLAAGAGQDPWPNGVGTAVYDCERRRRSTWYTAFTGEENK